MLGISDYLWRLLPGNPILRRVVETGGKRRRDLFVRCGYLGLLVLVVLWTLFSSGTNYSTAGLAELAKDSAGIFQTMSYLQLGLVALLAPIFTAGAITQEKDSQTYDILLATPLTNGQIVLGSLASRLFFVFALLLSGVPIFSVTQIFGGVAISSIVYSFLIAAATATVTGAMAMAIATFKIGTRRTIFSFYLFIIIYLVGGALLDKVPILWVAGPTPNSHISWLTGLHPFLALRVIFHDPAYLPPEPANLPEGARFWPLNWYLTNPVNFYVVLMFGLSLLMVLPSVVLLRRLAQSTRTIQTWVLQKLHVSTEDRTKKPRIVWSNPIAWREAKTKASAARTSIVRYGFIFFGVTGALILAILHSTYAESSQYVLPGGYDAANHTLAIEGPGQPTLPVPIAQDAQISVNGKPITADELNGRYAITKLAQAATLRRTITEIELSDYPRRLSAGDARTWLLGATIVEFAVILLIVTNAAASTVTREKEDGTLDLLLTTPITSRYYIWGKLRGLVSFVLPLVAVPVAGATIFVVHDLARWLFTGDGHFEWIVMPEALVLMPAMLVIVAALASILGMQMSLRCRTTVRAVMSSVGIIVGLCAVLGWCGFGVLNNHGGPAETFLVGLGAVSPFTLMTILIDPYQYGGRSFDPTAGSGYDPTGTRITIIVASAAAVAAYGLIVWSMYKSMVKNFDMTIRRQSR